MSEGPQDDPAGVSSLDTPVDWSNFPELVRATLLGNDFDAYLADIGVDPSVFDEPAGNV